MPEAPDRGIAIFLEVGDVFPTLSNDFETLTSLVSQLSRTDALFASALSPEATFSSGMMKKGRFLVAPLTVMTLDDLETLETSIEHFSLCDLLRSYSEADAARLEPLSRFMISRYSEKLYASRAVASKGQTLIEKAAVVLFPDQSLIE